MLLQDSQGVGIAKDWRSPYLEVRRIYGEEALGCGYGAVQVASLHIILIFEAVFCTFVCLERKDNHEYTEDNDLRGAAGSGAERL